MREETEGNMEGAPETLERDSGLGFRILQALKREAEWMMSRITKVPKGQAVLTPALLFSDTMKEWGCFRPPLSESDPCLGAIVISTRLIWEHSWDSVLEVLYHELAHFAVYLFAQDAGEAPHGPRFRAFAEKFGANPRASANYPPLDVVMLSDDTSGDALRSPVELRIRKLLALSESPNEYEAELALMKAHELMARYGISEDASSGEGEEVYVSVFVPCSERMIPKEEREMEELLTLFFGVMCIESKSPSFRNEHPGERGQPRRQELTIMRGYYVCGPRTKVKIALYIRDFIWNFANGHDRHFPNERGYHDYRAGLLTALQERLSQRVRGEAMPEAVHALAVRESERMKAFVSVRFRRVRMKRHSAGRRDTAAYGAGRTDGASLELADGIATHGGAGPKQLRG